MIWKFWGVSDDEDFNISAQGWFKITIVAAAVGCIFFVCSGLTVLAQQGANDMQKVSQAFAPFLVGFVAIVTFCAAIWRGKLNSEQIKQQKRQNDAKDEENLAKLMMDGAKMLGEEKDSHVLAGIAALQAVVAIPNTKFASHSMDVIADFILENLKVDTKIRVVGSAREALNIGAVAGYIANRTIEVTAGEDVVHENFSGFRRVKYQGGWIDETLFPYLTKPANMFFERVKFDACSFHDRVMGVRNCEFHACKFEIVTTGRVRGNVFNGCDFSNTTFVTFPPGRDLSEAQITALKKLKESNCFYRESSPPKGLGIDDWSKYLLVQEDA